MDVLEGKSLQSKNPYWRIMGAYGALGYEGINEERAKKVIECMERVLNEFERKTHLRFKESC